MSTTLTNENIHHFLSGFGLSYGDDFIRLSQERYNLICLAAIRWFGEPFCQFIMQRFTSYTGEEYFDFDYPNNSDITFFLLFRLNKGKAQ